MNSDLKTNAHARLRMAYIMRAVYSSLLTRNQYHILEMHSLKLKKKQEKTKEYNQRSAIYSQGSVLLPPGFANKENSCYANSILQCIFNFEL